MNARDFYEEFKEMLNFLGVGFQGMQDAIVIIEDGKFKLSAGGRECCIEIKEDE